jgi:hypothetical protein
MPLAGLFVDDRRMSEDFQGLAAVALLERDELEPAVAVMLVVPVNERRHPQTGLLCAGKGLSRVIRPVFRCPEQRFGVRVVIGDPWPGEGPEHALLFQPAFQRGRTQLFEKPAARRCRCRHAAPEVACGPC